MTTQIKEILSTVRSITNSFEATFSIGDMTKVSEFYTEDGMLLPAGSDFVKGKQNIKEYWQLAVDMGIKNIKIDILEIEQHGNTVIEMSNYTLAGADGELIDTGKGIVIWKYQNDSWKMHRDIWTSSLK